MNKVKICAGKSLEWVDSKLEADYAYKKGRILTPLRKPVLLDYRFVLIMQAAFLLFVLVITDRTPTDIIQSFAGVELAFLCMIGGIWLAIRIDPYLGKFLSRVFLFGGIFGGFIAGLYIGVIATPWLLKSSVQDNGTDTFATIQSYALYEKTGTKGHPYDIPDQATSDSKLVVPS